MNASCLLFLVTCMATELTRRSKFSELVSNHVFSNINRNKFVSIVNCNSMTYEIRRYH